VVHENLACGVNSLFAPYKSLRLGKFSISTETVEEKHFPLSQRGDSIYKPPMDLDYDGGDQTKSVYACGFNSTVTKHMDDLFSQIR